MCHAYCSSNNRASGSVLRSLSFTAHSLSFVCNTLRSQGSLRALTACLHVVRSIDVMNTALMYCINFNHVLVCVNNNNDNMESLMRITSFIFRSIIGRMLALLAKKFGRVKAGSHINYYLFLGLGSCSYLKYGKMICVPVDGIVTKREFPSA